MITVDLPEHIAERLEDIKSQSDKLYAVRSSIVEKDLLIETLESRYKDLKQVDGWKDDIIKAKDRLRKEREELVVLMQKELHLTNEVEKARYEYNALLSCAG